jgi:hypothetical protein
MADNDLSSFPRGQVALGAGDLQQCTDTEFTAVNGAKVVATLRRNPAGIVIGNKAVECTFNSRMSEDGPERDFFKMLEEGKVQQARFKFPGGVTKTLNCVLAEYKVQLTLEDGVLYSGKLVGSFPKDA